MPIGYICSLEGHLYTMSAYFDDEFFTERQYVHWQARRSFESQIFSALARHLLSADAFNNKERRTCHFTSHKNRTESSKILSLTACRGDSCDKVKAW